MNHPAPSVPSQTPFVSLSRTTLSTLRTAIARDSGVGSAAAWLQEAGYAGGEAMYEAFRAWLGAHGMGDPGALGVEGFGREASRFFSELGWGSLQVGALGDSVALVDAPAWTEAEGESLDGQPSCHLSTGLFADFFGRMAGEPLAVMEVECRAAGDGRCRFLLGSAEVMQALYDGMAAGQSYEEAAAGL